ncbi:MAG TPA: hypothetical protein VGI65_19875 [Steroidobacteraceae bacterium]
MRMSRLSHALTLGAAMLLLGACTESTVFVSTWKAPDAGTISPGNRTIAAVFVSTNDSQRRAAEDTLAADISARGGRGIASYVMLPASQHYNADAARSRLKEAGANGVVVMRVVGRDQQVTVSPGAPTPAYYGGFGPYWGYGWNYAYSQPTVYTDTLISVETLVYSLDRDKLLWASTSRTTNPKDLATMVTEVAAATVNEMTKQGLLAPKP